MLYIPQFGPLLMSNPPIISVSGGSGVAPTLDSAINGNFFVATGVATSVSLSAGSGNFTTATANEVIIATFLASTLATAGLPAAVSTVSGSTLTWTKRSGPFTFTESSGRGGGRGSLEVWYAKASATVANENITVTYATGVDNICITILAFAGANFSSPWDPNGSIPSSTSAQEAVNLVATGTVSNNGVVAIISAANLSTAGLGNLSNPAAWTIEGAVSATGNNTRIMNYIRSYTSSGAIDFTSTGHQPPFGVVASFLDAITS